MGTWLWLLSAQVKICTHICNPGSGKVSNWQALGSHTRPALVETNKIPVRRTGRDTMFTCKEGWLLPRSFQLIPAGGRGCICFSGILEWQWVGEPHSREGPMSWSSLDNTKTNSMAFLFLVCFVWVFSVSLSFLLLLLIRLFWFFCCCFVFCCCCFRERESTCG